MTRPTVKKYDRITTRTSPWKKKLLNHAAPADLVVRAHGLRVRGTSKLRRQLDTTLQFAAAPETQRPMWLSVKSKPKEGVLMVTGNQIAPHHRTHLGIPLQRRMNLSTGSRLANLVRTTSSKFHRPCPLIGWVSFDHLQAKNDRRYRHRRACTRNL